MGLKGRLVLVNLVDPNSVFVDGVLDHVKPKASRFIMDCSTGILFNTCYELVLEAFLI